MLVSPPGRTTATLVWPKVLCRQGQEWQTLSRYFPFRHCRSNAVKKPVNELSRIVIPRNTARPSTLAVSVRLVLGGQTVTPPSGNSLLPLQSNA